MLVASRNILVFTVFTFLFLAMNFPTFMAGFVLTLIASFVFFIYWKRYVDRLVEKKSFVSSNLSKLIVVLSDLRIDKTINNYKKIDEEHQLLLNECFALLESINSVEIKYFIWNINSIEDKLSHYYSYIPFYADKTKDLVLKTKTDEIEIQHLERDLEIIKERLSN